MTYPRLLIAAACVLVTGTVISADSTLPAKMSEALNQVQLAALVARQGAAELGFIMFKKRVFKEPHAGGAYIVNGDTPIQDDNELREFYDREIVGEMKSSRFGLLQARSKAPLVIVDAPMGHANLLDDVTRKNLSYCVSQQFGKDYPKVIAAMQEAAKAWEAAADIKFNYMPAYDATCSSELSSVLFDVRPVAYGEYYARSFFPKSPRYMRNVLIDKAALTLAPGKLTLTGILRHEFGHILSLRHEQTRPEAGMCEAEASFIAVTAYDKLSVMHYATCDHIAERAYTLSDLDKFGAACLYGAQPGKPFDKSTCPKI